ncbi:MAG: hemerythrin domain-containing protein [Burkholderiales bacterium]|nr:hemerythrin domain-containing protein [Burkholderiales bacterium]
MEKAKQSRSKSSGQDAISLLMDDHKKVQKLFKEFEKLEEDAEEEKGELARQICAELTIHAQVEEEIFYPAAREAIDESDLLDEAEVEHASAKELIAQIESMEPGDELYDAKVRVLGEYINHHVKEEQDEMFPKAKKAKMNLAALGEELLQRKQELQTEMGLGEPMEEEIPVPATQGRGKKQSTGARK